MAMGKRILVIGAQGFIGRKAVHSLAKSGTQVFGFDRSDFTGPPAELEGYFKGSITDRAALLDAVRETKPAAIVSLAAFSTGSHGLARSAEGDRDAAFAVNVDGLRNVVEASLEGGVARVVWSSSTVVLGPAAMAGGVCADESAPLRPVNIYGLTKALAEQISLYAHDVMNLDISALRPTLVLGPCHPYSGVLDPLKTLFSHLPENGPLALKWGSHAFDIVHVDDVAEAIAGLSAKPGRLAPVYHVNGGSTNIREIIDTVAELRPGLDVRLTHVPADVVYPLVSAARIEADIGFRARFRPRDIIGDCVQQSNISKGERDAKA